jgi:hypothetical protein
MGFFEMIHRDCVEIVLARYQDQLTGKYLVVLRATRHTHGKELTL